MGWLKAAPLKDCNKGDGMTIEYIRDRGISLKGMTIEDRGKIREALEGVGEGILSSTNAFGDMNCDGVIYEVNIGRWSWASGLITGLDPLEALKSLKAMGNPTTYQKYQQPHSKAYSKAFGPDEPIKPEGEQMTTWKNPKPKRGNKRELHKGQKVVVDGMIIPQIVHELHGDGMVTIVDSLLCLNPTKVYPLSGRRHKTEVQIGDIVDLHVIAVNKSCTIVVTKIDASQGLIYCGLDKFHMSDIQQTYSIKPESQVYKLYSCGTLEYAGFKYKTLKDLKARHAGYTFKKQVVEGNLETASIAEHYKMEVKDIIAKDAKIGKALGVALDHPINVAASEWALLVGASGSGKTTEAIAYAERVGRKHLTVQGTSELTIDDIIGYKSITTGEYYRSLLRDAVEFGYVYILDEIDGCRANALLAFNSLKNGEFTFPDTKVKVHKDFRFIATANTLEYSEEYNGRSPMDKATLLRFAVIEYDLQEWELALRYGLDYVKKIEHVDRKDPREIEREINNIKIEESL